MGCLERSRSSPRTRRTSYPASRDSPIGNPQFACAGRPTRTARVPRVERISISALGPHPSAFPFSRAFAAFRLTRLTTKDYDSRTRRDRSMKRPPRGDDPEGRGSSEKVICGCPSPLPLLPSAAGRSFFCQLIFRILLNYNETLWGAWRRSQLRR